MRKFVLKAINGHSMNRHEKIHCEVFWERGAKWTNGSRYTRKPYQLHMIICLSRPYHFKFFKSCLPQILLGSFWIPWPKCVQKTMVKIHERYLWGSLLLKLQVMQLFKNSTCWKGFMKNSDCSFNCLLLWTIIIWNNFFFTILVTSEDK